MREDLFMDLDSKPTRMDDMGHALQTFLGEHGVQSKEDALKAFLSKHDVHSKEDVRDKIEQMVQNKKQQHKPKLDKPRLDAESTRVGMSDETCLTFDTSFCAGIEDMCSVAQSVYPQANTRWCKESAALCKIAEHKYPDLKAAMGTKLCTQFNASVPACAAARSLCTSNKDMQGGLLCTRMNQLCAQ